MNREEFLQLIKDLNHANETNSYQGLLKYLTEAELESIQDLSLLEIKREISAKIRCNEKVSIREILDLITSFGTPPAGKEYRLDLLSSIPLLDSVKNLSASEQLNYAEEVIKLLRYTVPANIIYIWKELNFETQQKYMGLVLDTYKHNPYTCNVILITAPKKIIQQFDFEQVKKAIDIIKKSPQKDDYIPAFLRELPMGIIEKHSDEIIQIVKDEKIYLADVFLESTCASQQDSLVKFFNCNPSKVISVFTDELDLFEEILSLYFNNTGYRRIFGGVDYIEESKIINLTRKTITEKYSEGNSEKEKIYNYIKKYENSSISIMLWMSCDDLIEQFTDEELVEIYLLVEDNYCVPVIKLFSKDFFCKNINAIIEAKRKKGDSIDSIRTTILRQGRQSLEMLDEEIFIELMDKTTDKVEALSLYSKLNDNLKKQYFKDLYNGIVYNWSEFYSTCRSNQDINQSRALDELLRSTSLELLSDLDIKEWKVILNLHHNDEFYSIQEYYELIPEQIRKQLIEEKLNELQINEPNRLEDYISRFDTNILKEYEEEIFKTGTKTIKEIAFRQLKPEEITDEILLAVLDPTEKDINNSKRVRRFKTLRRLNESINKNLEPEILCDEIYTNLNIKVILRLTAHRDIQKKLISFKEDEIVIKTIQKISLEKENWLEWISYCIGQGYDSVFELLRTISEGDYTKITSKHLDSALKISMNESNYFNIKTFDELDNYEQIKFRRCSDILLDNQACKNIREFKVNRLYEKPRNEQRKFAIFHIIFGMDFEQVENLVKKYDFITDKIDYKTLTPLEVKTIKLLEYMKYLYNKENLDDITEMILNNPKQIKEFVPEEPNSLDMEHTLINIYTKLYNKEIYKTPSEYDDKTSITINEENFEVPIVEIKPNEQGEYDFMMFIRCEGAYDPKWKEPEDYKASINRPDITYHGNCKSLISNQLLGFPKSKGPVLGYSTCSLQLIAPWDIVSNNANTSLSIINAKWDTGRGVRYLPPKEMIDYTRHGHNEFVSDRLIYNEETKDYEKEMPNYVVWVQNSINETEQERETNPIWQETKKAAAQLGVPIVVINREKIIISEQKIVLDNLKKLANINKDTDIKEVLRNIIIRFENNVVGLQFERNLKEKYFSEEDRTQIYESIDAILSNYYTSNQQLYYQMISTIRELLEEESKKTISVNGFKVGRVDKEIYEQLKKYQSLEPVKPEFKTNNIVF